jgi:hypothetical protein
VAKHLDLRLQHPRPIYFQSLRGKPGFEEVFLVTDPAGWNEDNPFPGQNYTPRPPDERGDKARDKPGRDAKPVASAFGEKRRGAFPIGVAVQTKLPIEWYDDRFAAAKAASLVLASRESAGALAFGAAAESLVPAEDFAKAGNSTANPATVRVAVIGHGGLFLTPDPDPSRRELTPAKEKLLLYTVNWLLNRNERLPKDDAGVWQYPRVHLSPRDEEIWHWATFAGLPLLFAYLGLVVLLVRRRR